MSHLVKGNQLSYSLQREVLNMYVHRWTVENSKQTYNGQCPACRQAGFPAKQVYICGQALPDGPHYYNEEQWHAYHSPITTDAEWLKEHAFYVTKAGKLDARRTHAEPACLAD